MPRPTREIIVPHAPPPPDRPGPRRPVESFDQRIEGGRALAEVAGWPRRCPDPGCAPCPRHPWGHCAGRLRPVAPGRHRTHTTCLLICWLAYNDPGRLTLRDLLAFEHFRFGLIGEGGCGPLSNGSIGLAEIADGWGPIEAELGWDENPVSEGMRCLDQEWRPEREGGLGG